jgi:WD40 repeat protein
MSRDGKWLATANNFGLLQVWNWNEKRVMASYQFDVGIDHLSFPSKKPFLMALQSNGAYAFWDVTGRRGGTPQGLLTPALEKLGTDQAAHPFAVAADYDKRVCLLGGVTYENKRAKAYWCRLFGAETGPPPHKHNYFITACALSNDARRVASADALGNIDVWQADGDELLELRGQCRAVYSVGFGADWPAQPELTFGRNQYRYPTWDFNHYADRDKVFDLASRSIRDQVSQPPVKHLLASEDHELSFDPTTEERRLEVKVDNVLKSRIHFPARNQWRPLSYGLLRGDSLGLRDAVVTSMADGTIECFEPDRLMGRRTFLGHTDQVWSWDQARDQEFLLSGSSDGTMRLWKLQPPEAWGNLAAYIDQHGKVIHVIPRTPTSNAGIALGDLIQQIDGQSLSDLGQQFAAGAKWPFRPGQRVSVSLMRGTTTYQREVQLSNMGDVAQPLLSIFVSNDGREWIIWTPEGYFDASSGGAQLAGWHVNRGSDHAADFYPLDDFSEQFYRPDVIDMLLQTGNVEEALRLCSGDVQVPIAPIFIEQALPPQIRIIEPPPVTVTGSPTIEVLARILSDSAPERVSVKVNGKARYYRNVVIEPIVSDNQREYEYRLTVNLSPGENEIQVVAANAHALSQSTAILVDYRKEIAPKPKKRLLIGAVGISKYQHRDIDNLKYADDDAEDFARAWETQRGRGLFDEVLPPKVLKDENATEEGVREELLDWFRKTATQDDVVVLLVSGHGVLDKHTYYLVTHDADPNEISTTCVRWSDFAALAEDLDCPLVMFVDTCHAQAIVGVNGIRSDPFKMLARADLGVAVYAACQRRDKSREYDALEHGAFVHALLDILNTRAGDVDGVLKASELQTRLGEKVHELTDGDQTTPAYMLGDDLDLFAYPK